MWGEVREEGINPQPPGQPLPQATLAEASLLLPEAPLVHRRGRRALGGRPAPAPAPPATARPCNAREPSSVPEAQEPARGTVSRR